MTVEPAASPFQTAQIRPLDPRKFKNPYVTVDGVARAAVELKALETLWFNTGTLCNIACANCYIESSPRNDALAYLSAGEVRTYLDELAGLGLATREIGFTGGEPFMNRDILPMLQAALKLGYAALVLTNAMRPMQRWKQGLLDLKARYGEALTLRVSLDHYLPVIHDSERGAGAWEKATAGLTWLARQGFGVAVAGRRLLQESEAAARSGYARLFFERGLPIDAENPDRLVLFPEMDAAADVPEITEACWGLLGKSPDDMMCASSRMVVKRKGASRPVVVACTLTPYDKQFELGHTIAEALGRVRLNHPHCAKFCVLGGASCSRA